MMARPIVRPLSRYVLRRHVAPFGLALAALTSVMLIQQIAKQLPDLHDNGLPSSVIVEVFVLSVPFIVAVTLPMAVLVAVLRVFTRLAADSEITVMHPGGVSVLRLITPVLGAAACVAALSFLWNDQILPRSNHRLRTLQIAFQRNLQSFATNDRYKSDREMTGSELRQAARTARGEAERAAVDGRPAIEHAARRRAATYEVEIEKKYAIAAACIAFALVGAPVALRFRRGGDGLVLGMGVAMFTVYYVGLIGGEELGDRLIISPFFAMWTPNLIFGVVGLVALSWIRKPAYGSLTDSSAMYRNTGDATAAVTVEPTTKTYLGVFQRLRALAPKSEKTGYIGVIAFPAILVFSCADRLIAAGLDRGGLGTTATVWLVYTAIAACLITFALVKREPWAYWFLFAVLWLVWLFYVWNAAANPLSLSSSEVGGAVWGATFDLLVIAYLYRRRWWFGVDLPTLVPEKTLEGGSLGLFVLSVDLDGGGSGVCTLDRRTALGVCSLARR